MACRPLSYGDGFVRGMLDFVDCQARTIGAEGYQALAAPGSTLSLALTGLLTLFVAFYGYRMLFGQAPAMRDGVLALAKIGVVLALATSWPAYRALVYDVALLGPAQLASDVGEPASLPAMGGGLVARLQGVDTGLIALAERDQLLAQPNLAAAQPAAADAPKPSEFDPWALGGARILFLTGAIGALAAVRLVSGLLLALGPFFIAFLLFDATRGLFEGWVRALAGAALGAVAVTILLAAELALLEPWLSGLLARQAAGLPIAGAHVELLVVSLVFGLALLAALGAAVRIAAGFRLPGAWRGAPAQLIATLRGEAQPLRPAVAGPQVPAEQRSRAAAVAEAVAAAQRRELVAAVAGGAPRSGPQSTARDAEAPAPVPLGQSHSRRTRQRGSGSAGRRDRRT